MFKKLASKARYVRRKSTLPVSLRTTASEVAYATAKKMTATVPLLDEPRLRQWENWALIDNAFPYNAAFKDHHMLIPKRAVAEKDLTVKEKNELAEIIAELGNTYDCYLVNFRKKQSIRNHYHMHLLTYKDSRTQTHF